jgi:hypothetical protein
VAGHWDRLNLHSLPVFVEACTSRYCGKQLGSVWQISA